MSAFIWSVSESTPSCGQKLIPMLAPTYTILSSSRTGLLAASTIRSATATASASLFQRRGQRAAGRGESLLAVAQLKQRLAKRRDRLRDPFESVGRLVACAGLLGRSMAKVDDEPAPAQFIYHLGEPE